MRLVRSVQAVVGLAAASGLALMLSGSAWAADSSVDTIAQPRPAVMAGSHVTPRVGEASRAHNAVAASDEMPPAPNEGQNSPDANVAVPTTADQLAADQNATTMSGDSTPLQEKVPVVGAATPSVGVISADKMKPVITLNMVDTHNGDGRGMALPASVTDQTGDAPVAPAGSTAEMQQAAVILHRVATILPIQPIIMNHMVSDLAALIPSAPMPAKAPVPAQSAGLLSSLAYQLASTALPQFLMPHDITADSLTRMVNLGAILILFLNVFTFTYGQWLRRSGFATAARSDASATFTPLFATPSLLGYAALPLRLHNPLFGGGRNEILKQTDLVPNAYRKEEKL